MSFWGHCFKESINNESMIDLALGIF